MPGRPTGAEVFMATRIPGLRRFVPAAGLAALATAVFAHPAPPPPEACPAIDPPSAAVPAGIRAFIDPATGKIRPATLEERRKLAAPVWRDRSGRAYELQIRADGTRIVKLDEAFMMSVVATKNSDGTISYHCRSDRAPAAGGAAEIAK